MSLFKKNYFVNGIKLILRSINSIILKVNFKKKLGQRIIIFEKN